MKKTLCLVMIFCFAGTMRALCGQQFDAAAWHGVPTYDVDSLKKIESAMVGKVVGLRFNYRGDRMSHLKPSWYEGSVWRYRPSEKEKFAFLRVMVAKKDLAAFKSIPTDFKSAGEIVVYGEVGRESNPSFLFVRLFGRKVTLDAAGNATVDW